MHLHADEMSGSVGDDVSFAPVDLFPRVVAAWTAAFRGFHRLAVDDAGARAGLPPGFLARRHHQRMVDPRPAAVIRPAVEVPLHGRVGRKLLRQLSPLATGRRHVEQRLYHLAKVRLARPSDRRSLRHERLDQRPLRIRHVACVPQTLAPILTASDLGLGHREAPFFVSQHQWNHNLLRSLNSFSVRL